MTDAQPTAQPESAWRNVEMRKAIAKKIAEEVLDLTLKSDTFYPRKIYEAAEHLILRHLDEAYNKGVRDSEMTKLLEQENKKLEIIPWRQG